MFRNMLVRLQDSPETEFAVSAALAFAKGYGSTVTGVYVREEPPMRLPADPIGRTLATFSAHSVPVMSVDEEVYAATEGERQARTILVFETLARQSGVPFRCDVRMGSSTEAFAEGAGTADVVTMPRNERQKGVIGSEFEYLVKSVPHPFLIASEAIEAIDRIAVAYDGSPGSVRALAAAADIARHWKSGPPVIELVEVVPPGEPSRSHLAAAEAYLDLYELPHTSTVLFGKPAVQLAGLAEHEEIDLFCMGAYGHSALRELVLGSTTQAVVGARRRPILLCH